MTAAKASGSRKKRTQPPPNPLAANPTQARKIFDRVRFGDPERAKAVFLSHYVAGYWVVEVANTPSHWGTVEFRVSVIDPATVQIDPRRCHTFQQFAQVEAYIRRLRLDYGGEPPTLGELKLIRLGARK
jgi:hypothetical protein